MMETKEHNTNIQQREPVCYRMETNGDCKWRPHSEPMPREIKMSTYLLPDTVDVLNQLDNSLYMTCITYVADTQIGATGKAPLQRDKRKAAIKGLYYELAEELGVMPNEKIKHVYRTIVDEKTVDGKTQRKRYYYYVIDAKQLKPYNPDEKKKFLTTRKYRDDKNNRICFMVVGTLRELQELYSAVTMRKHASDMKDIIGIALIKIGWLKKLPKLLEEWDEMNSKQNHKKVFVPGRPFKLLN